MRNRRSILIIPLAALLMAQGLCGQTPASIKDYLAQRFREYCGSVPREEIFIHTDRDEYIAGEEMWLNIYLIDRQSYAPSPNSTVAYVELLNSENRPVAQKRFIISRGYGPGLIDIPDTLTSGSYTLRAYTRWMMNFLPVNCYTREITVYNTLGTKPSDGKINLQSYRDRPLVKNSSNYVSKKGISLKTGNPSPDILEILVTADNSFISSFGDQIYLVIQTHGNINYIGTEKLSDGTTRFTVAKSSLSEGINQVTVFSSKGEPLAEKYCYTPAKTINKSDILTSESYKLRSDVTLEFEEESLRASVNSGNISISVAPASGARLNPDISDYIVFGSEFGPLPWKILKGRKISELSAGELDSLLAGISSNWIRWPEVLSGKIPAFRYPHENDSQSLTGRLFNAEQQPAGKDELLFQCIPGKKPGFQYARTDDQGNFIFRVHIDEEMKDLIILPDDISRSHKIIIESPYSDKYYDKDLPAEQTFVSVPPYVGKWSLNYQVGKIYKASAAGKPLSPAFSPIKQERFYGKPDLELIMADYIKLPVMEEVIFELLPMVSLRKRDGKYEIVMHSRIDDILFTTVPVLMIDGVIIKDAKLIVDLDPETVERIDVVNGKYLVGKYLFPSILNVVTKEGDFSGVTLPDYMIRLPYRVADPVPSFVSPEYSSEEMKSSRLPDYRNTLYWNPSIKPGKDGKLRVTFWTSDNAADYIVSINGLTSGGKTISATKIISVK